MSSSKIDNTIVGNTIDLSSFTDEEIKAFTNKRSKMFKYTWLLCIFYAVIAIAMLIFATVTEIGKKILFQDMLPFVLTYILGTIVIILYLSHKIYTLKPEKINHRADYDSELCPDFWNAKYLQDPHQIDDQNHSYLNVNLDPHLFIQKCSMDPNLINKNRIKSLDDALGDKKKQFEIKQNGDLYIDLNYDTTGSNTQIKNLTNLKDDKDIDTFKKAAANMAGYSIIGSNLIKNNNFAFKDKDDHNYDARNTVPLVCNNLYPMYIGYLDEKNNEANPNDPSNKFRCAFANACGYTWTDSGCL